MAHLRIGTRGSKLAVWQAEHVASLLKKVGHSFDIVKVKTTGDKITDVPLAKVGGKGLFVKELEVALQQGFIDIAVHSMKDVPTLISAGLRIAAVLEREDPRDAFVSNKDVHIGELPKGAVIGTSSLRRKAQILSNYRENTFYIKDLRGNLDTRLRRLREGKYDGIIVAAAGMKRMGLANEITHCFSPYEVIPAVAQGAIGIEIKCNARTKSGVSVEDIVDSLNHSDTELLISAERAFLTKLEGGCQIPIAAHAQKIGSTSVKIQGAVWTLDGDHVVKGDREVSSDECNQAAVDLAEELLSKGAKRILDAIF